MSNLDPETHQESGLDLSRVLYAFDGYCHFFPGWYLDFFSATANPQGQPVFTAYLKSLGELDKTYHYLISVGFNQEDLATAINTQIFQHPGSRLHSLFHTISPDDGLITYYAILEVVLL